MHVLTLLTERLSLLVEFVLIASSNVYDAPSAAIFQISDFSASVLALFAFASTTLEFLAA